MQGGAGGSSRPHTLVARPRTPVAYAEMAIAGAAGGGGDAHQERAARAGQRGCARSAVAAQVLALNLFALRVQMYTC